MKNKSCHCLLTCSECIKFKRITLDIKSKSRRLLGTKISTQKSALYTIYEQQTENENFEITPFTVESNIKVLIS